MDNKENESQEESIKENNKQIIQKGSLNYSKDLLDKDGLKFGYKSANLMVLQKFIDQFKFKNLSAPNFIAISSDQIKKALSSLG